MSGRPCGTSNPKTQSRCSSCGKHPSSTPASVDLTGDAGPSRAGAGPSVVNSMAGKVEERRKRKQAEAEAAARKRTAEAPIDLVGAAAEGLAQTPGQAAAAKRPAVPASSPLFNPRQHAKSQAEEEARRLRLELHAETKRREAAEQKVKEVEEQVRAAAWRQTQAHQAEMAQRDAAHQAQLEAARQEVQQARASASSSAQASASSSSQAPASSSAAASSADDEDADLTRCEVGLRQHIELLREHERLQRKLADAQRKGKAKATGVFDTAGDLEIKVSRNVELRELCSSVSAYWATRGGRTLRRLWL